MTTVVAAEAAFSAVFAVAVVAQNFGTCSSPSMVYPVCQAPLSDPK